MSGALTPKNRGRGAWTAPAKRGPGNPGWKAGQPGNPHGKPIGTRNKISKAFLEGVLAHWEKNGAKALDALLERDPVAYAQMLYAIASVQDQPTGGVQEPSGSAGSARAKVLAELAEMFNRPAPPMIDVTPTPNGSEPHDG